MQTFSKTKKAINFDLNDNLLKRYYPSKNYKKGWRDIKRYLENNNFIHRQYSGYVSKEAITMAEVGIIIDEMSYQIKWLKKCIKEFDVTIIGNEYSFIQRINNTSINKFENIN